MSNSKNEFKKNLTKLATTLAKAVSTNDGDWTIKGFIDINKTVYTISKDTKVVSKIVELMIFPLVKEFAEKNGYRLILTEHQNYYPDLTFVDNSENKFAVDIKSTYRKNSTSVNGMTLGAFTGYFRDRNSIKNIKYPYNNYVGHFVLGLIYSRTDENIPEETCYSISELSKLPSVIKELAFFRPRKISNCFITSWQWQYQKHWKYNKHQAAV